MKFYAGLCALLSLAFTVTASVVTLEAREEPPNAGECGILAKDRGKHRPDYTMSWPCSSLQVDCINKAKTTTYIWSKTSCVAAAICESPNSIVQYARCSFNNPQITTQYDTPALSTNIYKNIVGSCADQGCPITQQNFVDFIYSSLTAINSTHWPESVETVVEQWWNPLKGWANAGETVPYAGLNDFLHLTRPR